MKKILLTSSFKDVADMLRTFLNEELKGKTVTFIPTASLTETVTFYVNAGKKALEGLGLIVDPLELTHASVQEVHDKLKKNDYIYITGGNTFFLLQELRKSGADKIIVEQVQKGKLYIGESAGSMILAPNIEYVKDMDDCQKAPELTSFEALSLINFYPVPHHTNFPFKKAVERIISKYEEVLPLLPISNTQAISVFDEEVKVLVRTDCL